MPGRNGTGPYGEGPATGWGFGPCVMGREERRGLRGDRFMRRGRGFGMGMGSALRYQGRLAPMSLRERKEMLEAELEQINTMMTEGEAEA